MEKCRVCTTFFFFSQIVGKKDSYVFAHDWDMPDRAKLSLWMLGFLY